LEVHLEARPNLSLPVCSPSTCFTCFCRVLAYLGRHAWPIEIKVKMAEEQPKNVANVHSSFCDVDKSTESC
jgi:hypothetical protein